MNEPPLTLAPGDRVPNFVLPNHQGTGLMFYNKTKGGPVVLLIYGRNGAPGSGREVEAVVGLRPQFDALGAELFLINRDSRANNAALVAAHSVEYHVLSDPMGKITAAFAAATRPGWSETGDGSLPAMCLVLDRNQRVLAVLHAGERTLAERAVDVLRRDLPVAEGCELSMAAPVLMLPNMLDPATCRQLIETWETRGHTEGNVFAVKEGKTVSQVDFSQKKRLDHYLRDDSLTDMLMRTMGPRIADEVFKAHSYDGFVLERFVIGAYDDARGDYFRPHRDNLGPATASRRFAMSLNLNDGYKGGGIVFPEYGPHVYRPPAGAALIFSCALIHEAQPVTSGRRFVLLTFLRDEQNRPHPWSHGAG